MEFHLMQYVPESFFYTRVSDKTVNNPSELEQKENSNLTSRIEIVCTWSGSLTAPVTGQSTYVQQSPYKSNDFPLALFWRLIYILSQFFKFGRLLNLKSNRSVADCKLQCDFFRYTGRVWPSPPQTASKNRELDQKSEIILVCWTLVRDLRDVELASPRLWVALLSRLRRDEV